MSDRSFFKSLYIKIVSVSYESSRDKVEQYVCKQAYADVSREQIEQVSK